MKIKHIILSLAIVMFPCLNVQAQDDLEYRWEVGAGIGLMTYTGDFNSNLLASGSSVPEFSVILRRTFNPYSHMRFALSYGKIKGDNSNLPTFYPDYNNNWYKESARDTYSFSNTLIDLNAIYEYNFWPYGTGRDYRGAVRLTPFIAFGLGFTYVNCTSFYDGSLNNSMLDSPYELFGSPETTSGNAFTVNMPLGVGVKYKVGDRTNLQLEWLCHFSASDKLDGVKDPYRIASSGIFKNTDCYSVIQASITYSFGPKCKTCMNSDW